MDKHEDVPFQREHVIVKQNSDCVGIYICITHIISLGDLGYVLIFLQKIKQKIRATISA